MKALEEARWSAKGLESNVVVLEVDRLLDAFSTYPSLMSRFFTSVEAKEAKKASATTNNQHVTSYTQPIPQSV
jgi:hypothetical protein